MTLTWIIRGAFALLVLMWVALVGVVVVEMLRNPEQRDWRLLASFVVLKLPALIAPLFVLVYSFWRVEETAWTFVTLFVLAVIGRWALVRFVTPPEAFRETGA
jgi:hypothetical protein